MKLGDRPLIPVAVDERGPPLTDLGDVQGENAESNIVVIERALSTLKQAIENE